MTFSMADNNGSPTTSRRRHIVRLALLVVFLLGLFYLVAVSRVIDVEEVRRVVAATGPAAPLTYIVVSALLGAIFVPGPILAAGSGVLFGPVLGTFVTLGSTVGTATVTSLLGRRAGRDSARALLGPERADRIDAQIERRGLWAVVGQRFVPGISDALASYAFGAYRIGTAGLRLHRTRCIDRRSGVATGVLGDCGVVRDRHHRGFRRTAGVSTVARRSPRG
jgi:uncharacterized membrane protein YdjX (TVP38/TMEM64 family)